MLDGPVQASGYDWYQVQPTLTSTQRSYPFGWVAAAGKDGEPWIEPDAKECPPLPTTVDDLGAINQTAAMFFEITCFGGEEITFEARLRVPHDDICHDEPWGVDPVWLDLCMGMRRYSSRSKRRPTAGGGGDMVARLRLEHHARTRVPQRDWPIVEVTGMFDHPAAETCRNRLNYEEPA